MDVSICLHRLVAFGDLTVGSNGYNAIADSSVSMRAQSSLLHLKQHSAALRTS